MSRLPDHGGANWEAPDYYQQPVKPSHIPFTKGDYRPPTFPVINADPSLGSMVSAVPRMGWVNTAGAVACGMAGGYWAGARQAYSRPAMYFGGFLTGFFYLGLELQLSTGRLMGYLDNHEEVKTYMPELAKQQFSTYSE